MSDCVSCLIESASTYSSRSQRDLNEKSVRKAESIYYDVINELVESKSDIYQKLELVDAAFDNFDIDRIPYMTSVYDYKVELLQTIYKDTNIGPNYSALRLESIDEYAKKSNEDVRNYMDYVSKRVDELYANSWRKKKWAFGISIASLLAYITGTVLVVLLLEPAWYTQTTTAIVGSLVGILYARGFLYVLSDLVRCKSCRKDMTPWEAFKGVGADIKDRAQSLKIKFNLLTHKYH